MAACDQIEHVLSKRSVQWMLRQLAKQDDRGECTLTRIMATYGRPNLPLKDRLATTGADYVEVSIDSARADRHDEFRGRSGYWRRSMAGLKNLIADGRIRTGLACTVTSMNIDEINDVIEMAKDLGVSTFYVFNFIPTGRALNIQDMDITPDQREELLEIMQAHLDEGRISVMGTTPQYGRRCMQHYWLGRTVTTGHYGSSDHSATPLFARYIGGCGAGRCMLAIQPNGDVTPCVFMPIVIGNLRAQRIHDIWRQSEVLWKLQDRDILQGHCGVCEWKLYCGGCRARAYGYFGDVTAPDPGCTFNIDAWRQLRTRERLQRREAQERMIAGQSSGD